MSATATFCLFEGRHELPANQGALCTGFNFDNMTPVYSNHAKALFGRFCGKPGVVQVYVTGLTPAALALSLKFTQLAEACKPEYNGGEYLAHPDVFFMHYNKESGEYVPQRIV